MKKSFMVRRGCVRNPPRWLVTEGLFQEVTFELRPAVGGGASQGKSGGRAVCLGRTVRPEGALGSLRPLEYGKGGAGCFGAEPAGLWASLGKSEFREVAVLLQVPREAVKGSDEIWFMLYTQEVLQNSGGSRDGKKVRHFSCI